MNDSRGLVEALADQCSVEVDRTDVLAAIRLLKPLIRGKNKVGLEVLQCVLVRVDSARNMITFEATDLDIYAVYRVPGVPEGAGSFLVPANILASTVKTLPKGAQVTLTPSGTTGMGDEGVELTSGTLSVELSAPAVGEYPMVRPTPEDRTLEFCEMRGVEFQRALHRVKHAVSKDVTRRGLNSVQVSLKPDAAGVEITGTDGHRMAVCPVALQAGPNAGVEKPYVLISSEMAGLINGLKLWAEGDVSCKIGCIPPDLDDKEKPVEPWTLIVEMGNLRIVARETLNTYPRVDVIMGNSYQAECEVGRGRVVSAVDTLLPLVADEAEPTLSFRFSGEPGSTSLHIRTVGEGKGAVKGIPCVWDGRNGFEIHFDGRYLWAMLAAIPDDEGASLKISCGSDVSQALFQPHPNLAGAQEILMPRKRPDSSGVVSAAREDETEGGSHAQVLNEDAGGD